MEKIIIDCDPGIDDTLALMYIIASNKFDILGITTVSGNVPADEGLLNVYKVLDFLGVDIPVYMGYTSDKYIDAKDTHGENGLGNYKIKPRSDLIVYHEFQFERADEFMVRMAEEYTDVTIIALGPLTNIWAAMALDPYYFIRCVEIISMGGTFRVPGNCTPVSEYNYWCDPTSAKYVFDKLPRDSSHDNITFTMIGLDVTRKVVLTHDIVNFIKHNNPRVGELVEGITDFYFEFHKKQEGLDGCVINDPVAVFYLIDPNAFFTRDFYARVLDINSDDENTDADSVRGMVLVDENEIYKQGFNVKIATDLNVLEFWDSFLSTIIDEIS